MALTSPWCPLASGIAENGKSKVTDAGKCFNVNVNFVFDPPWNADMTAAEGMNANWVTFWVSDNTNPIFHVYTRWKSQKLGYAMWIREWYMALIAIGPFVIERQMIS
jgi:metal-sulfur cluster biosynthetic enzyme